MRPVQKIPRKHQQDGQWYLLFIENLFSFPLLISAMVDWGREIMAVMHLSMLSPRGRTTGICGAFDHGLLNDWTGN